MSSQRIPPDSRERPEPARGEQVHDPLRGADGRRRGHLLLMPTDLTAPPSEPAAGAPDLTLAQLRAAHDAALEEIAFLREQLRSLEAYSAHVYEQERARLADERDALRREIERLGGSDGSPLVEPVPMPERLQPFGVPRRGDPARAT